MEAVCSWTLISGMIIRIPVSGDSIYGLPEIIDIPQIGGLSDRHQGQGNRIYIFTSLIYEQLVGHLARMQPFLKFCTSDCMACTGAGASKHIAALATPVPAGGTLASPFKRRWRLIPMACYGFKPADDLVRRLGMLSSEGTPSEDTLDRLGHVQPGGA
jgi:hypothetical protein